MQSVTPRLPNLTYRLARRRRKDIRLQVTEDAALDSHSSHFDGGQRDENIPETSFDSHWYIGARKMNRTKGLEYGDYIWELIDPETLELTGDLFFEHDNIVPELLRRQGIHTVVSPDCPSEDKIRTMLEAKALAEADKSDDHDVIGRG